MTERQVEKNPVSSLALFLIIVIIVIAVLSAYLGFVYPGLAGMLSGSTYTPGGVIYDAMYIVLTIAADALYIVGGGVITFGALLLAIRFIQIKLKDPYNPSSS